MRNRGFRDIWVFKHGDANLAERKFNDIRDLFLTYGSVAASSVLKEYGEAPFTDKAFKNLKPVQLNSSSCQGLHNFNIF